MRVAIVAAEPSGDLLGAGLMGALQQRYPDIQFEGIGGQQMLAHGLHSLEPMESLSVMGLVEVIQHLPTLIKLRRRLREHWLNQPPDLFIGVDAPDFNLSLETALRKAGIKTVHYVCPTVWAWRPKRVFKVREAVDLVLSIFPFEKAFLDRYQVPNTYVGHTLAAEMPVQPDREAARQQLGLPLDVPVIAVLPGSRVGEVARLAAPFLKTAELVAEQLPELRVIVPQVNTATAQVVQQQHHACCPGLAIDTVMQGSQVAMAAANVVLTASGTATLEGLLSKRPMVVGYQLNGFSYVLAKLLNLVKVDHIAMANLLAEERLAPEFVQGDCVPEKLAPAVMHFFKDEDSVERVAERYGEIHRRMAVDSNTLAADAVQALIEETGHV